MRIVPIMAEPTSRRMYLRSLIAAIPGKTSKARLAFWIARFPDGCGASTDKAYNTTVRHCQWAITALVLDELAHFNYCPNCLGHLKEPARANCRKPSLHFAESSYRGHRDRKPMSKEQRAAYRNRMNDIRKQETIYYDGNG